jgi:hypothetical protein
MHITRSTPSRLACLLTAFAVAGNACTSMHPVPMVTPGSAQSTATVKPGDKVRLTMRDGRSVTFVVQEVDNTAIVAQGSTRYPLDDITTLERKGFSGPKTAALVAGAAAVALLFAWAAAVASLAEGL